MTTTSPDFKNIMGTYILRCADGTLYTGATKDIFRRIDEHNSSPTGAKYTKIRRPVSLVYFEPTDTWSIACSREYAIKLLSRPEKLKLIGSGLSANVIEFRE